MLLKENKMPPIAKFTKDDIINVTYNIIENEGIEKVNARRIATELGSSVQPIFHNFTSIKELLDAVYGKIYALYVSYMRSGNNKDEAYKEMGLSYIRFAKEHPNFFKLIFMQDLNISIDKLITDDDKSDEVIKAGQKLTGLSYAEQVLFHRKVWLFTHGIACLVATKTIDFPDREIEELLKSSVRQMLTGYKKEKEENEKCN